MRQEQKKRLLKTTSLLVSNIANGIKAEELRVSNNNSNIL